jgi:flagellar biosynthesis activator protein FlaF
LPKQKELIDMDYASKAYAKVAKDTMPPRELEANLLLNAAARLQAVHDSWSDKPDGLNEALLYNRKLWTIFIDAVLRDDNQLPRDTRDNLIKIGAFVMGETFSLMTKPKPKHLATIIKINRRIATGLRGKH